MSPFANGVIRSYFCARSWKVERTRATAYRWRAWLAFLDSRCPAAGLTRWMVLVDGGYRARCTLEASAIEGLNKSVDTWIRKHV